MFWVYEGSLKTSYNPLHLLTLVLLNYSSPPTRSHRQRLHATGHQPFTMLLTPEGFGAVALVGHLAIIAQFVVRCAPTSLPRSCAC